MRVGRGRYNSLETRFACLLRLSLSRESDREKRCLVAAASSPTEQSKRLARYLPACARFKANYSRGDGKGGIAIIDSDSVEAIIEGITPWVPFFEFEVTPVMDIQAAVPALQRAQDWRDSVS